MYKEEKDKYDLMMEQYPILYCDRNKSEMESCMHWGISAGEGWYKPINELSQTLEELNHKFKIYGVRIRADQVKSKYAELRFYYSIKIERNIFIKIISFPIKLIINFINKNVDFKYEKIIDKPAHIEEFWREISKEDYDNKKIIEGVKNEFGYKFKEENGKYYRNGSLHYSDTFHYELKNHKFIDKIKRFFQKIEFMIERIPFSKKKIESSNLLNKIVEILISDAESTCWNTCELCGHYDYSGKTIITTKGWMTRICLDCNEKK